MDMARISAYDKSNNERSIIMYSNRFGGSIRFRLSLLLLNTSSQLDLIRMLIRILKYFCSLCYFHLTLYIIVKG